VGYSGKRLATCADGQFTDIDNSSCQPVGCAARLGFPDAVFGQKVAAKCPTGINVQTATCGKDGFFENIDMSACPLACPADQGFPVTPVETKAHAPCGSGSGQRHRLCRADGTWDSIDDRECSTVIATNPATAGQPDEKADSMLFGRTFAAEVGRSRAVLALIRGGSGVSFIVTCGARGTNMPPRVTSVRATSTSTTSQMMTVKNEDGTETTFSTDQTTGDLFVRTPGALLGNATYKVTRPLNPYGRMWMTVRNGAEIFLILFQDADDKVSMFYITKPGENRIRASSLLTYAVKERPVHESKIVLREKGGADVTLLWSEKTLELQGQSGRVIFLPYV